jgi:rhodanese-related sulfurtransferase
VNVERATRVLGMSAIALGALAVVAGSPGRSSSAASVARIAGEVSNESDHVTAVELARWIRDRKAALRIIDVRDSVSFEESHIPGAIRQSLEEVAVAPVTTGETIVLYSGGGAHAAQGWVLLRSRGVNDVFFLRGGYDEWMDEVMNPQFPRNAPPEERAAMDSVAALSRYFGGVPRNVDSLIVRNRDHDGQPSWRAAVKRARGRGC